MTVKKYGETLPAQCPPSHAIDAALSPVFRLVPDIDFDDDAFASFKAKGDIKPEKLKASDCDWASCSLRTSAEALLKLAGLRRRNPYIVTLTIPTGVGKHTKSDTHVNFWRYAGVSLTNSVTHIEPHGRT